MRDGRDRTFQQEVHEWCEQTFGEAIAHDKRERCLRFLEEALELVQSLDLTESEVDRVVLYVYNRTAGKPPQEMGGVMVTLAALADPCLLDMEECAETELARCWVKMQQIREKNDTKPSFR